MLKRVLFVDDDLEDQFFFKKACEACKVVNPVLVMNSGHELFTNLKSAVTLPALILLDINLPMQDGFEILEELKAHATFSPIPVLMLSTASDEGSISRAHQLGAACFLTKPALYSEVIELICQIKSDWLEESNQASL